MRSNVVSKPGAPGHVHPAAIAIDCTSVSGASGRRSVGALRPLRSVTRSFWSTYVGPLNRLTVPARLVGLIRLRMAPSRPPRRHYVGGVPAPGSNWGRLPRRASPPQAGLYSCLVGGLVFWLFCNSRQIALMITSAISFLIGNLAWRDEGGAPRHEGTICGLVETTRLLTTSSWRPRAPSSARRPDRSHDLLAGVTSDGTQMLPCVTFRVCDGSAMFVPACSTISMMRSSRSC